MHGASGRRQAGGGRNSHAYYLSNNALSAVDLHPASGYYSSMATSTDGVQQCGYAGSSLGGIHAMKWSGSSSSYVDLHPSGFNFSYCTGVDNGQQSGFAEQQTYAVTKSHAILWSGSSAGVDLHPLGYVFSRAMALRGGEQVGYGSSLAYPYGDSLGYHSTSRALRWNGTAASAVSLHPAGFDASEALATNGVQQGGWGYIALGTSHLHALLWSGTAESVVDLHPSGYTDSKVYGMNATQQVGEGWVGAPGALGSVRHALVWSNTAGSVVDLNQYLPAGYTHAVATGIDEDGNVVGYAYNTFLQGMGVGPDTIAMVWAKGQPSASALASLTLNSSNVEPGASVQVTATLAGPAPAGGVTLTFLSTNPGALPTPASVTIASGQSSATFATPAPGTGLTVPTSVKLFATDGVVSKVAPLTITPVVRLSAVSANAVEGGFPTTGTVSLSIPAQAGGAVVTLTSGNPALFQPPASVVIPQGTTSRSFSATTSSVTASTTVPLTAVMDGTTLNTSVTLSPAPVVTAQAVSAPASVVGGQAFTFQVQLSTFVRDQAGATVTLNSGNAAVAVPASVFIPKGSSTASVNATTTVVPGSRGVSLRASYNGSQATSTIQVDPLPSVTIISAVYKPDTQMLKVDASTSLPNSTLTYGTNGLPFGTMQLEAGLYQGSIVLATAPATVTVWNSVGGEATMPVTISVSGGGGSGGGGGGGGSTSTFKLSVSRRGKGTVVSTPSGIGCGLTSGGCSESFASGTAVTLTATPDPGSAWKGWSGACSGTAPTCTVTMTADQSVEANFK
ncbi:MAG: hypothetical protein R2762_20935 [Bryobacteraceae bacterium]